jgi:hypothetical protein
VIISNQLVGFGVATLILVVIPRGLAPICDPR